MRSQDIPATPDILGHWIVNQAACLVHKQAADSLMKLLASKEFVKLPVEHVSTAREEMDADGLAWAMLDIIIE
jgi:hypothetical protein